MEWIGMEFCMMRRMGIVKVSFGSDPIGFEFFPFVQFSCFSFSPPPSEIERASLHPALPWPWSMEEEKWRFSKVPRGKGERHDLGRSLGK